MFGACRQRLMNTHGQWCSTCTNRVSYHPSFFCRPRLFFDGEGATSPRKSGFSPCLDPLPERLLSYVASLSIVFLSSFSFFVPDGDTSSRRNFFSSERVFFSSQRVSFHLFEKPLGTAFVLHLLTPASPFPPGTVGHRDPNVSPYTSKSPEVFFCSHSRPVLAKEVFLFPFSTDFFIRTRFHFG